MPAVAMRFRDTCPACDRFISTHTECPYCGVESPNRPLRRALKITTITLSVTGLVLLLLLSRQVTPPILALAELSPTMNHGRVTVIGTVAEAPRLNGSSANPASIAFTLTEAGGRLCAITSREIAEQLVAHHSLPAPHDRLQVTGTLYLAAGKPARLYVDSAPILIKGIDTP